MTRTAMVTIGNRQWQVVLAESYAELTTGLRGVSTLSAGTGMLFNILSGQPVSVTTQGMSFPIDIIFISAGYTVLDVVTNVSPNRLVSCGSPVWYFLEVPAGEAEGISPGETVDITVFQTVSDNDWLQPVLSIAGLGIIGTFVAGAGTSMMEIISDKKTKDMKNLDLFPDSLEFLAYTIDDIGYRTTIDNTFLRAIARAKGGK